MSTEEVLLEALTERIRQIKESRPIYREILDFYQKVTEEQNRITVSVGNNPLLLKREGEDHLTQERFPLLQRQDFPIDAEACVGLFRSLSRIAKDANPFMSEQVRKIEETMERRKLDVKELLREGLEDKKMEQRAEELGLDETVFLFLIQNSLKPFIERVRSQITKELEPIGWEKGICPICGSLPFMSLLDAEGGKKTLLCSFCGYPWRIGRFLCPFCNNREQGSLHYFYAEFEESYRIDICEKCRQYIKTIDLRKTESPDPSLEDVATLHLDILALQKGYKRPVRTLWAALNNESKLAHREQGLS
jgi:FdhE protein